MFEFLFFFTLFLLYNSSLITPNINKNFIKYHNLVLSLEEYREDFDSAFWCLATSGGSAAAQGRVAMSKEVSGKDVPSSRSEQELTNHYRKDLSHMSAFLRICRNMRGRKLTSHGCAGPGTFHVS